MIPRFKQLINLYLDGEINRQEQIELKRLITMDFEKKKEFQRQLKLHRAMQQIDRACVFSESTVRSARPWRMQLGWATIVAACAVLASLVWVNAIDSNLKRTDFKSFVYNNVSPQQKNSHAKTQPHVHLVHSVSESLPSFQVQHLPPIQSLNIGMNTNRQAFLVPYDWRLHDAQVKLNESDSVMPRAWRVQHRMDIHTLPNYPTSNSRPQVQPASFRFP